MADFTWVAHALWVHEGERNKSVEGGTGKPDGRPAVTVIDAASNRRGETGRKSSAREEAARRSN
ncbi:MAG TPA: hypothetical protein VKU44_03755 [Terriglobia bacterium]|nr:hypothetical protein [Terriglobia bacterium]